MKKIPKALLAVLTATLMLSGCAGSDKPPVYDKYQMQFFGAFDTIIQIVGYAPSQKEFESHAEFAQKRFTELSQTFDRFSRYDGVNNIKSVNDNAGLAPVKVEPIVIELVELCREWYDTSGGQINIAMGPVLSVWHDYMALYSGDPENGKIPTREELETAAAEVSLDDVITDSEKSTLYLTKPGMMLDLGAAAKGYAAELVADELYERGFTSFLISAGGNVVSRGTPMDGVRNSWGVGIQDPFANAADPGSTSLDVVFVSGESVVTSGDYQRFYVADGQRMHHIIDPDTLMPANYYRSLSIVHEDSGIADILSTSLFCMDYQTGRAFADEHGIKALWVFPDGRVEYTQSLLPQLRDRGNATSAIKK